MIFIDIESHVKVILLISDSSIICDFTILELIPQSKFYPKLLYPIEIS